jgi:hypothetical protein
MIGAFSMGERQALFTTIQPLVTIFDERPWNWRSWSRRSPTAATTWKGRGFRRTA